MSFAMAFRQTRVECRREHRAARFRSCPRNVGWSHTQRFPWTPQPVATDTAARAQPRDGTDGAGAAADAALFSIAPIVLPEGKRTTRVCRRCKGATMISCKDCRGTGQLPRGGYHAKRNHINMRRVVGSKWTAMERTFGWRHFRATQKRREGKSAVFVLLVATCDDTTQFWVDVKNLKDRQLFAAGWLQKAELDDAAAG